jgi:hypothetical protein
MLSTTATRAHAAEREARRGTLLVGGQHEPAPLLYVATGTVTRVRFVDLQEPHALPGPELQGRIEVAPLGEDSLVVSPVRDLAKGERLLLSVTGRTAAGESLTLTLALVTREDSVDTEAWVSQVRTMPSRADVADADEAGAVARKLLASHGPGATRPRLALELPGLKQAASHVGGVRASASSVLQMDGLLFVTVRIHANWLNETPWRLIRARLEAGCRQGASAEAKSRPLHITSSMSGRDQLHTLTASLPEGVGCLSLILEEDGPRTLRLAELKVSP